MKKTIKKRRLRFIVSLASSILLAAVISASVLYLALKIDSLNREIDGLRSSIFTELESHNAAIQRIYSSSTMISEDIGEIRKNLGLPPSSYGIEDSPFAEDREDKKDGKGLQESGEGDETAVFFKAIDRIEEVEENRRLRRSLSSLFSEGGALTETLEERELSFVKEERMSWRLEGKNRASGEESSPIRITARRSSPENYTLLLRSKEGMELSLKISTETFRFTTTQIDRLRSWIDDYLEEQEKLRALRRERIRTLKSLVESEKFRDRLEQRQLKIVSDEKGERGRWRIYYPQNSSELRFGLASGNGVYSLEVREHSSSESGVSEFKDFDTFQDSLYAAVSEIDTRKPAEIARARSMRRIRAIAEDEAFEAYLRKRGLRISIQAREGNDHYYFDILKKNGERFGSFAVLKKSGKIYIVDSEEVTISSFLTLDKGVSFSSADPGTASASLPDEFSAWKETREGKGEGKLILLCGVHEDNADTIMLAQLGKERVAILSLPRDLYYEKRKLTSYYQVYGPEELMRVVTEIIGLPIDGYISVDMYAFIEIVDILGGIELTLEEALIDPTYKVRVDGHWKTLYYPAGEHKLDGIEALRIGAGTAR